MASSTDISSIPTPAHCTADFCLIPVSSEYLPSRTLPSVPTTLPAKTNTIHATRPRNITCAFAVQIGTSSPSVSAQIADVQRLVEKSGLKYVMHSAGTTLEGPWDRVHQVIGQAHTVLHQQGIVRIQTDVRVGSRTDKEQSFEDKVNKVRELLGKE
ncbi:putative cell wall biogenesis protein Ecm15 [Aspergillus bombycis]|uniref:Putative cell wall biogenesis protein Ecm15 n=1 Tax=Aspergillus bombycis TaxID=109264 RepID=A0A1F7ZMM9_9EURO|nr:putative cell wall biogenesis protein Ecm15 [Aspergillus bombycis]OGM40703.1 putative cell wall biogenesis protein Ecm15 [Aspergillus bombycis]